MPNRIFYQPVFNIIVITGKMYTSYKGIYGMHTVHSGRILIHIDRSIPCVFMVQFGESSRDISLTFVFKTTVSNGVIIPGNYSEIQSCVANDVTRPEIKFHVDSISITMVLDVICKIESVFRPALWQSSTVFHTVSHPSI